ncbi:pentapeptide repeat-containing protein [Streptomyces sp. NPDC017991]|uniref:pentapeptide repeat-containing protein n=1 Tax=Streptomyces sp. NPDC017991 TaxID=3365026 RepID=UPI0037B40C63
MSFAKKDVAIAAVFRELTTVARDRRPTALWCVSASAREHVGDALVCRLGRRLDELYCWQKVCGQLGGAAMERGLRQEVAPWRHRLKPRPTSLAECVRYRVPYAEDREFDDMANVGTFYFGYRESSRTPPNKPQPTPPASWATSSADMPPKPRPRPPPPDSDAPHRGPLPTEPDADVQAVLTRTESRTHVDPRKKLDLHGLHLAGAHLNQADLIEAILGGATLTKADLAGADLISVVWSEPVAL